MKIIFIGLIDTKGANVDEVFSFFNSHGFKKMKEENYHVSEIIFKYLYQKKSNEQRLKDSIKKMITINYANSLKFCNKKEEAVKILDSQDWSATTENYKICVEAIKDNKEYVMKKMKIAVLSCEDFDTDSIREWPVFIELRKDNEFREEFEREFNEKIDKNDERKELRTEIKENIP